MAKSKSKPRTDAYYLVMFDSGEVIAGAEVDYNDDGPIVVLGLPKDEAMKAAASAIRSSQSGEPVVLVEMRDVRRFRVEVIPAQTKLVEVGRT